MEEFLEHFKCFICREICKNAVESICCYEIFCRKCVDKLTDCPKCRSPQPNFRPSVVLRRLIGVLPCDCSFCEFHTSYKELENHLKECIKAPAPCNYCDNQIPREALIEHYASSHPDQLIEEFDENSVKKIQIDEKRIEDKVNTYGRLAKIGRSGKFYCGGQLEGKCACCKGICGPMTGCNCVACMQLDIAARRLPKGFLVNSNGMNAKVLNNGRIYCGTMFSARVPFSDGYCGPSNGPNCKWCKALEAIKNERYRLITAQWD
ncbi:unnamed protein product [Blepharisma stoltei]|uniref:RING-type domain-containing protein n=1 Tax=Blepharisma stoltei TaxID=1481888 RepID=A0AAU9K3X1_9CILI|nr:unnamed protein product [Blepharisma stoltei]